MEFGLEREQGEPGRVYDLSTPGGAFNAIIQVILPVGALCYAYVSGPSTVTVAIAGAALTFGGLFALPAWLRWFVGLGLDAERQRLENASISPQTRVVELNIELTRVRESLARTVSNLDGNQIEYAKTLTEAAALIVDGTRIIWRVSGVEIPVWFADEWYKMYLKRGDGEEGEELPADRDWDRYPQRELLRDWNSAISEALVRLGGARAAGSNHPPRWLTRDITLRHRSLDAVGLWRALDAVAYLNDEPETEEEEGR